MTPFDTLLLGLACGVYLGWTAHKTFQAVRERILINERIAVRHKRGEIRRREADVNERLDYLDSSWQRLHNREEAIQQAHWERGAP